MMENAVKQFQQSQWKKAVAGKGGETVLKSLEQRRNAAKGVMKDLSRSWIKKIQSKFMTEREAFAKKRSKDKEAMINGSLIFVFCVFNFMFLFGLSHFISFELNEIKP